MADDGQVVHDGRQSCPMADAVCPYNPASEPGRPVVWYRYPRRGTQQALGEGYARTT